MEACTHIATKALTHRTVVIDDPPLLRGTFVVDIVIPKAKAHFDKDKHNEP